MTIPAGAEGSGEPAGTCGQTGLLQCRTAPPPAPSTGERSSPGGDAAGAGTHCPTEAQHLSLFGTLGFLPLRHPLGALKNDSHFGFQADELNLLWLLKWGSNLVPRSSVPDGRGEEVHTSSSHAEKDSKDKQLPQSGALPLTHHHLHLLPRPFCYRPGAFGTSGPGLKARGWAHQGHRGLWGLTPLPSSPGGARSLYGPFPQISSCFRETSLHPLPSSEPDFFLNCHGVTPVVTGGWKQVLGRTTNVSSPPWEEGL